jgi:hypothetical protein
MERSLKLWPGNSVAHAVIILGLIKQNKMDQASEAIKKALQQSITTQHIQSIASVMSSPKKK